VATLYDCVPLCLGLAAAAAWQAVRQQLLHCTRLQGRQGCRVSDRHGLQHTVCSLHSTVTADTQAEMQG
jgi:hypothetical protein